MRADSRSVNASRNIVFGTINRFVTLCLPFVTRTIMLYLLGAEFLGIGSLFSSILSFLSLAELGLSSAIVFQMYKPIAQNNTIEVNALLKYYRRFYRIIGTIMLSIGTVLLPIIPFTIKGNPPAGVNVYILYYIYLINSVLSYFFAGYKQCLLTASQRSDITNNISTVLNLILQFGQILALYFTRSIYVYACVPIICTAITNLLNAYITRKKFPQYRPEGEVEDDIKLGIRKRISGLFGTKLNSIVVHSSDTLVISAFLGLTVTAQYGNYYYIMNAVCGFVMVFYSSLTAGIGNKIVTETTEECYSLFKNLSFVNAWMVGFASCCFVCLYQPFMKLWVGEDLMFDLFFVIIFTLYFFVYEIQRTILTFKDAAGLWYEDRMRPYVSMIINVVFNIILVQFIGIYGIVISTILAFLISVPWANKVLFKNLFKLPAYKNILSILGYLVITIAATTVCYLVCTLFADGWLGLAERVLACLIIPNLMFVLAFFKTTYFKNMLAFIKRFLHIS